VNIACVVSDERPASSCVGDWVLIHVGFAMSRIDEDEAAETLRILTELGEALLRSIDDKARDSREANAAFFGAQAPVLVAAARTVASVYRRGGRLFSMGNGGSS